MLIADRDAFMLCLARALPHELNRVDKSGRTALHLAAACGYKDSSARPRLGH